ncbi:MAG TPA: hypothetical protein PK881_05995 [Leptospiraceae bacterium]|nr:hypothetical protein [Leptospiraceae bacterium]HNJ33776.1 hypothetical protein [Leptospiraceae bacterium]HNL69595.1 hypothetical protein [Leptospiraceae bacterium]
MRPVYWIILVLTVFFAADSLIFRAGIYTLPNESAWETEPFYNLESAMHHLRTKSPDEFRILIVGSSLAMYGFLYERMEERMSGLAPGKKVKVFIVAHQGMHGLELAALTDRYAALKPDLVILPVNMVDLRLERPILMSLMEDLGGTRRKEALDILYRDLAGMYAVLPLAGQGMVEHYGRHLNVLQIGKVGLFGLCEGCRLKLFLPGPASTFFDNRFSRGKSYDRFAGGRVEYNGEVAVTHRGHVPSNFAFRITPNQIARGMDLEIMQDGSVVAIRNSLKSLKKEVQVSRGWVHFDLKGLGTVGDVLQVQISTSVYMDVFDDRYAARLTRNFATDQPLLAGPRPRRREDELLDRMDDATYRKSFQIRNLAFEKPGYQYLKALYDAKKVWGTRAFDPDLPAIAGVGDFVRRMPADTIVLNFPENPLTLSMYGQTRYYRDYVKYLQAIAAPGKFVDASSVLPARKFYDYHHLTWYGAGEFSDYMSDWISREYHSRHH